jgi:hypothetical protein
LGTLRETGTCGSLPSFPAKRQDMHSWGRVARVRGAPTFHPGRWPNAICLFARENIPTRGGTGRPLSWDHWISRNILEICNSIKKSSRPSYATVSIQPFMRLSSLDHVEARTKESFRDDHSLLPCSASTACTATVTYPDPTFRTYATFPVSPRENVQVQHKRAFRMPLNTTPRLPRHKVLQMRNDSSNCTPCDSSISNPSPRLLPLLPSDSRRN